MQTLDVVDRIYAKRLNIALKDMKAFCKQEEIEVNFPTFLFYNHNGICSPAYYSLHLFPKQYLVNSKSFYKYDKGLDIDFQQDIITHEEISSIKKDLKRNKKMLNYLRNIQGDDSLL